MNPPPHRRDSGPAAPPPQRRNSGFALLLVFVMAAAVGIMLWLELPRVSYEAERIREQTLIQRGEEYKHAIKLFYRRFQRYPPSLDALENTNNIRFLRRRYKDPMTGKDEWRLIHAGPGGIFTDSLTQKPLQPPQQQNKDSMFTSVSDMAAASSSSDSQQQQTVVSMVPRRRASEGVQGPPGTDQPINPAPGQTVPPPDQSAQLPPPTPGQPSQTGQPEQSPSPGFQPSQPMQPGQAPYLGAQPGQAGQPGMPFAGQPGQPGQPGMIPGFQAGVATNPAAQSAFGSTAGSPGGPGTTPVPGLIDNMMRNPPGQNVLGGQPVTVGGGIAGVATKMEATGIMIYNDRRKFNEWEFLYDPRKELAAQMGALQNSLQQPVMPGATTQPGQTPGQSPTPFPGFGSPGSNQH
ncbi:MAG: hypothetical protein ACLQGV_17940 [Bryobacteraceae bacterium]